MCLRDMQSLSTARLPSNAPNLDDNDMAYTVLVELRRSCRGKWFSLSWFECVRMTFKI